MNSNFKKGICLACLSISTLFLAVADTKQTHLQTHEENKFYQNYKALTNTTTVDTANETTSTFGGTPTATGSVISSPSANPVTNTLAPFASSNVVTNTIAPTTSILPTGSANVTTSGSPTSSSIPLSVSDLYIQYQGKEITSPTVLTKDDFLVTAIMEDSSQLTVTDYTFTSKTEITEPGETIISIAYAGKTASCQVSYIEDTKQHYYSVTLDSTGGSDVPPILSITPNSTIRLPEPPVKTGYWFRGWYTDPSYTNEFNTATKITKDYTLYAKWEEKKYSNQDIMSTYITFDKPFWFFCTLEIDLSDQTYGVHTVPVAEAIPSEDIADAAKNISDTTNYFAFRFDVDDYTFKADAPLNTTVTIPNNYNINKVHVFYSPDEHHIQGMCHGEAKTIDTYTFSAYNPGTYIVMEVPDAETTVPPEPTTKPSITVSLASRVSVNGQTIAQLKYHNFNEDVLDPEEITFIWKSSKPSVASVTQDGVVTGNKKGTATITVTSDDKQFTASAKITVGPKTVKIKKLTLNKTKVTLKKGKTFSIKATISPSNATTKTLKYSSTNKKIATVSSKGKIKAIKKGSCTIKVSTTDGSKITKKIKVTVKQK